MKPGDPIGLVGVLLLFFMLAVWIAAELFPDFQIIPSRKKRPPGEPVVDAMFILYTLFLAGFGLCVPLGLLVKLGMPVEVLTLPALMGAWAMLQLMNLFCFHQITEHWIGVPLFALLLFPNVLIGLAPPLGLLALRENDSPITVAGLTALVILGALTLSSHIGITFVLIAPGRAANVARRIPGLRGHYIVPSLIAENTVAARNDTDLVGSVGTARTPLRPVGKVVVGGTVYQARSTGPFIDAGAPVEILKLAGGELIVRGAESPAGRPS